MIQRAISAASSSQVDSLAELQALVTAAVNAYNNAFNVISAYAQANGGTAPQSSTYIDFGIVNVSNVSAINSALASTSVIGTSADTPVEVQVIVDAYNRILLEANGAIADASVANNPSMADYQVIGVNLGAISNVSAYGTNGLALYNDIVANKANADVDTIAELDALADVVSRILEMASGASPSPALSPTDLALIGLTGVTPSNLTELVNQLAGTPDNASAITSLSSLQALANSAALRAQAINEISAYANANQATNTVTEPTVTTFSNASVANVNAQNIGAMNSALATSLVTSTQTGTTQDIQTIVDAYNRILAEANGANVDANPNVNPSLSDYQAIGVSLGQIALNANGLSLLNSTVAAANTSAVDTVPEINSLSSVVNRLLTAAAGAVVYPALTVAELASLGLTGVTPSNLANVLLSIANSANDGSGISSLSAVQQIVNSVNAALPLIRDYAQNTTNPAPIADTFMMAGILNVTPANLAAINSALATDPLAGAQADTVVEVQAIVDAYNMILREANGSRADADASSNPTASDYSAIGAVKAASLGAGSAGLALLNDLVGKTDTTAVDTVPEIEALASVVEGLMVTAAGGNASPAITANDFAAMQITGVNAANLADVMASIAASPDAGSDINSVDKLQAMVDAVISRALGIIQAYAGNSTLAAGSVLPVVADFLKVGVTGVDSVNVYAMNSALATTTITSVEVQTAAQLQAMVDAYRGILAEANGLAGDLTPTSNPLNADYAKIGATKSASLNPDALNLLNSVIGDLQSFAIDSVPEIEALATTVEKIMTLATGGTPSAALTIAELEALGITGVRADQLTAFVNRLTAGNLISVSQIDTVTELRAVLAAVSNDVSLAVIGAYAGTSTLPAGAVVPSLNEYINAGVVDVNAQNLGAINSTLATAIITESDVNTLVKVQAIVDAWNVLLAEANGAFVDATPSSNPSAALYATIGAEIGLANTNPNALSFLNSVIAKAAVTAVDSVPEINALALIVDRLMQTAAGQTVVPSLSISDLQALGLDVTGSTAADLANIISAVAATPDSGSGIPTLADLQGLINQQLDRLPTISGLALSADTGASLSDFITKTAAQIISATLNAPLAIGEKVYGRLDGVAGVSGSLDGWVDLTSFVQGATLDWTGVTLLAASGSSPRSIQLQVVRLDSISNITKQGNVIAQNYQLLTVAPASPTQPANLIGPNPTPTGLINLGISGLPVDAARVVLLIDGREVPSLYHAMTNTIMPLAEIPLGVWTVQYQFEDAAGNRSQVSPPLAVSVVAPQTTNDMATLDGDGILFDTEKGLQDHNKDGIDDSDQRDVVSFVTGSGQLVSIDTTAQNQQVFSALLTNNLYNPNGVLKVVVQLDEISWDVVNGVSLTAALASYGVPSGSQLTSTDLLNFRMYPQIVRTGTVSDSIVDAMAAKVIDAFVGQTYRVDIRLPESKYDTYFKVRSDGSVWAFTWDHASGTGARFIDTNSDGNIDMVSLYIKDGGRGDDDGKVDGVIVDPGFATFVSYLAPNPTPAPTPASNNAVVVDLRSQSIAWYSPTQAALQSWFADANFVNDIRVNINSTAAILADHEAFNWGSNARNGWPSSEIQKWTMSSEVRGFVDAVYAPRMTSDRGFSVRVADGARLPLAVLRGQPDAEIRAGVESVLNVVSDAFVHKSQYAVVRLDVGLMNGQKLPSWISINPVSGKIVVKAPARYHGDINLRLTAEDGLGNKAVTVFRLSVKNNDIDKLGRPSLSDKLKNSSHGKMPALKFKPHKTGR